MMKVILDMDGVLKCFISSICRLHNRPDPYYDPSNYNKFDMAEIWGMSKNDFFKDCGYDFWFNMQWHSEGQKLLSFLQSKFGFDNICIVTSPCATKGCVDGKLDWIAKYLPLYKNKIFVGKPKEFFAHPGSLLIDDCNDNIVQFELNKGHAFLVPRPWNANYRFVGEYPQTRGLWLPTLEDFIDAIG